METFHYTEASLLENGS